MGLRNPGRALGRSCLLLISPKLPTLSGIPPASINSFRLASFLALLVGLNLSFLIDALAWFIKITKVALFESIEVFRRDPFLALYFFFLSIDGVPASLPSSVSCSLYAGNQTTWFSYLSVPAAMEATQGAMFRLERWSEYWCLPPNPSKCGTSFFSVDSHQANLQPNLPLLTSRLRFNPTPTFLGVTFDRTLSFSIHVSSQRAKFFPRLKTLRCISASSWGHSKESLSFLYKAFLRSLFTYASPGWFPYLSATNITKLERLHRADSRAITSSFLSSPIPLLPSEASLPPLRVTLTHFTLSAYKWALRLPTSFPISGLARLGVKPRLCTSSWRAFASTHPLVLPSTSPTEALLACPPFPFWNLPSLIVESILSTSCSRSDPPSPAKVRLSPILTLFPLTIWYSGLTALFLLLLSKAAPAFLPTALCGTQVTLSFPAGTACSSFSAEACAILHAFRWSRKHQQACLFSSLLLLSDSRSVLATLSTPPSFLLPQTLWQIRLELPSLSSCSIRLQWVPVHSFLPGNDAADELDRWGALLALSAIPCSLSPLISRIHSCLFSDRKRTVSSKFFDTRVLSISTEELVLPRHARCVLSPLRCNGHSFLLSSCLSKIGIIENHSCSACGHSSRTPLISFCTVQLRTLCAARSLATLCLSTTSGPSPGELPGFWGSVVFRHAPIPRKGSGNNNNNTRYPIYDHPGMLKRSLAVFLLRNCFSSQTKYVLNIKQL